MWNWSLLFLFPWFCLVFSSGKIKNTPHRTTFRGWLHSRLNILVSIISHIGFVKYSSICPNSKHQECPRDIKINHGLKFQPSIHGPRHPGLASPFPAPSMLTTLMTVTPSSLRARAGHIFPYISVMTQVAFFMVNDLPTPFSSWLIPNSDGSLPWPNPIASWGWMFLLCYVRLLCMYLFQILIVLYLSISKATL